MVLQCLNIIIVVLQCLNVVLQCLNCGVAVPELLQCLNCGVAVPEVLQCLNCGVAVPECNNWEDRVALIFLIVSYRSWNQHLQSFVLDICYVWNKVKYFENNLVWRPCCLKIQHFHFFFTMAQILWSKNEDI